MNNTSLANQSKQIIFFDVDGVLVHGYHARSDLRKCWDENIGRDFGIDRERFKNEFIFGPFVKGIIIGKKNLQEELAIALPKLGYSGDPSIFLNYWLKNDSNTNMDLIDKIKIIKNSEQVRLFIATNQEHNRARYLMEEMGLVNYFEDIFYSGRIGARKPNKEYFEWISSYLNLKPDQQPIFFDDTPAVVNAARDYGWDAIEFHDTDDLYQSSFVRDLLEIDKVLLRTE